MFEELFENEFHQKLFRFIKNYLYDFKTLPTPEVLKVEFVDEDFVNEIDMIIEAEILEDEWIEQKLKEVILYERLKGAITKSVEVLKKKDKNFEVIKSYIDEALNVRFEEEGYRYFEEKNIIERLSEDVAGRRVATGIRKLDEILEGGLGAGELGIVAGITGYGKTLVLQNFAVSAVLQGYPVIYYTFEESTKDLARRFDKIFTEMTSYEIQNRQDEFMAKLRRIYEEKKAELIIKFFPMYSITPFFIKNDIITYRLKGLNPGLVIVDYGQRLKSPRSYEERWQELIMIYDLLSSIALELQIPLWTAVQVVKKAIQTDLPDLLHVSGARDVMNSAHIGISIAQSNEEKERGEMRLFIMKARRIGARKVVKVSVNYSNFVIRSWSPADVLQQAESKEETDTSWIDEIEL